MNKSQRIYLSTGNTNNDKIDKNIKVKLEQNIETLEFLTLSLGTADIYQNFNADYGVLVGRVIANGGIGIPNAKISIFIPLSDEDAENDDIYSIYPYKTPRDKNTEGKRYNLLPRVSTINPETQQIEPKQAFGSFPIKAEIVTNQSFLDVYKKYYKYTAVSNDAGDYMIFGLPIGTQVVHMSVDITDIGEYSMNAASMVVNLGYSSNLFTDNNTKIKPSNDLGDLPHIETQEISVDIIPFWGDIENFEIGITRQDFRIRATLKNTFTLFGSVFTDAPQIMWGNDKNDEEKVRILYNMTGNNDDLSRANTGMNAKRVAKITEKIYYFPSNITDVQIVSGDYVDQMLLLDPSEYSTYKRDGNFAVIVNCNRDKIIIGEDGNQIPVDNTYIGGIYTKFKGFITLEITEDDASLDWIINSSRVQIKPIREKLKFPQYVSLREETGNEASNNVWRNQHFTFNGGKFYSVARFHPLVQNILNSNDSADNIINNGHVDIAYNVGIIQTNDVGDEVSGNAEYEMTSNITTAGNKRLFGANWLNLSVYLPQLGYAYNGYSYIGGWRVNSQFTFDTESTYFLTDNTQEIAGGEINTKWFARGDYHWTDIIEVPKTDITTMNRENVSNGFKKSEVSTIIGTTYRNGDYIPSNWTIGACPAKGGRVNGVPPPNTFTDPETYFYKGFNGADCIDFIVSLGLV